MAEGMSREEALELLRGGPEGIEKWNEFRRKWYLRGKGADPVPNLSDASLSRANLSDANLGDANLSGANLNGANLNGASLRGADLRAADLREACLWNARLSDANLTRADLAAADLVGTQLHGATFKDVVLFQTVFSSDLSAARGLDSNDHFGPSILSNVTLASLSQTLPKHFLAGCGLADWEIEAVRLYDSTLPDEEVAEIQNRIFQLRCNQPLQFTPLFISYTHGDADFVDALETQLTGSGVRFWRDTHDAPAGPLDSIIEQAMRSHPVVLLVLSENSVESDWVESEAGLARELEKDLDRHVLCPVALDDSWRECGWSGPLHDQIKKYNVLRFHDWRDEAAMASMFQRLLEGLGIFYKGQR